MDNESMLHGFFCLMPAYTTPLGALHYQVWQPSERTLKQSGWSSPALLVNFFKLFLVSRTGWVELSGSFK